MYITEIVRRGLLPTMDQVLTAPVADLLCQAECIVVGDPFRGWTFQQLLDLSRDLWRQGRLVDATAVLEAAPMLDAVRAAMVQHRDGSLELLSCVEGDSAVVDSPSIQEGRCVTLWCMDCTEPEVLEAKVAEVAAREESTRLVGNLDAIWRWQDATSYRLGLQHAAYRKYLGVK